MRTQLTIDQAGRILLPKSLRDEMNLPTGDELHIQTAGKKITLRPAKPAARLSKAQGVWVVHTGKPVTNSAINDILRKLRNRTTPRLRKAKK